MESAMGIPRINIHNITMDLDVNKQVTPINLMETLFSITDLSGDLIDYTIDDNVATITEPGYVEGSKVAMWIWCFRASEGGGMCQTIFVQSDQNLLQDYQNNL